VHSVDFALAAALLGGGLLIAIIGFLDDSRSLTAGARFAVHIVAAVWAVYLLGGLPPVRVGTHLVSLGFGGNLATVIAIVWTLNLFNFMDGIDGIAASEAVFILAAGSIFAIAFQHDTVVAQIALVIAAASLAFLCWNWPPAKIFMGDVGSGYLGYMIAVVGLAAARTSPVAVIVWLILGGIFFVDATITLVGRLATGQRIYLAHRDHLYQRLAARWQGHSAVTVLVCSMNILLLLPLAVWSSIHEELAAPLAAVAILCLSALMIWARARAAANRVRDKSKHWGE
jgi:Fuc2NAc and GlcNAc transferase